MGVTTVFRVFLLLSLVCSATFAQTLGSPSNNECVPPGDTWQRPYFVILLADPQIGWNTDQYNSEELFRIAIPHVKKLRPGLVLVAGDLIQNPGNVQEYNIVHSVLQELDNVPYHVIAGNHDILEIPILKLLNQFVDWWNIPHYWYTVTHFDTLFVMLESNMLRARDDSGTDQEVVHLAMEQLDWLQHTLDGALQDPSVRHIVPVAHHPLAISSLSEKGRGNNMPIEVRQELLDLFDNEKISHVFAGHFHHNTLVQGDNVQFRTYASTGVILGDDVSGFAIFKFYPNGTLQEDYYGYQDLPPVVESDTPGFTVVFPNGNEILRAGSTACITWLSDSMVRDVALHFTLDAGNTWTSITEETPNNGAFQWEIPTTITLSDEVKVRVSSYTNSSIQDESDEMNRIVGKGRLGGG